jgi:hypothetical protein
MKARSTSAALGLGLLGAFGVVTSGGAAHAQTPPSCNDTTRFPNPVFLAGSSAFEPVIQAMAYQLAKRTLADGTTPNPINIIYQVNSSCQGVGQVVSGTMMTGSADYYTAATGSAGRPTCMFDSTLPAVKTDIGISDVFFDTCAIGAKPATIGDFLGPAQAMMFLVPKSSNAFAFISAEQAQIVYGCGGTRGMVTPWLVDAAIQQRSNTSGTQNVIARHINVLASAFQGMNNAKGGDMINSIITASTTFNVNVPIGFAAGDTYATSTAATNNLRPLAFRAFEQNLAYFADSAVDTFDKRNVRDGHYVPWGYEHLFVKVDSNGKPTSTVVANLINYVLNQPVTNPDNQPNFDPVQVEASSFTIPLCAMKVQRQSDGGYLSPFTPSDKCGCFYESIVTGTPTPPNCTACTDNSVCTNGKTCQHSFCE